MKKVFVFCLVLCLSVVTLGLYGCGDNSDLKSQLDETQSQLDELEDRFDNSTNTELKNQLDEANRNISALTERIQSLESTLSQSQDEIRKLTELSSTLSQTITELSELINDQTSGNEALKAKLEQLQSQYEQTEATISSLLSKVSSLETNVNELQTKLDEANSRIDILESVAGQEPPVLNMGDTFVLKSPTGIEMLRFRPVEYRASGSGDNIGYFLDFNIERLHIPSSVPIDSYFTVSIYSESLNEYLYKTTNISSNHEDAGNDFNVKYGIGFSGQEISPEDVTYIMIGLPSDNNLDDNHEKMYIIPYAFYVL